MLKINAKCGKLIKVTKSNALPNNYSVLGSFIDPLGLFQDSPLVSIDQYDRKILESAQTLLSLLQKLASTDTFSVSPQDSIRFLNILTEKLWKKRRELAIFGTGVASQLIENSIARLDQRGEERRKHRTLRGSGQQNFKKVFNNEVELPKEVLLSEGPESVRLRDARNLMREIQASSRSMH